MGAYCESESSFNILKKRVYTLFVRISKSLFMGTASDVAEHEFDTILAEVCVSHFDGEIDKQEFNELSGYLVRTYELYKLERSV